MTYGFSETNEATMFFMCFRRKFGTSVGGKSVTSCKLNWFPKFELKNIGYVRWLTVKSFMWGAPV